MSKLRSLSTAFWSDPFVEDLTPQQKLLFIYLITNEKTNMLGIYENSIRKISFETGIKKDDIEKALKEFERLGKVKYSNNYVVLVNYMKHQNYNTNMKKSAIDIYNKLPNHLKGNTLSVSKDNPIEGFKSLLNHYGMVRKVEYEYEYEYEAERELEELKNNKPPVFNFRKSLIELGADKDLASDWIKVRKTKKATNSKTALNGFISQLEKSKLSINQVLKECVIKSWGGFNADWVKDLKPITEEKLNNDVITYYWKNEGLGYKRTIEKSRAEAYFKNQEGGGYHAVIID